MSPVGIQKTKAAPTPNYNWSEQGNFEFIHTFQLTKDNNLIGSSAVDKNGASQPSMEINYGKGQPISFWDFFDPQLYGKGLSESIEEYKIRMKNLSERSYFAYLIPGTGTFYLIIDKTSNTAKGIYKKFTVQKCYDSTTGGSKQCPWQYFKAYSSWQSPGSTFVAYKTDSLKPEYSLTVSPEDQKSKLYQYIQSINKEELGIAGAEATGTNELTLDEAKKLFPEGTFNGNGDGVTIHDAGDNPPFIIIPKGPTRDKDFRFTLKYVLRWGGAAEINQNFFYFVATDPNYSNLAIRIDQGGCKLESRFFLMTTIPPTDAYQVIEVGNGQIFFNKKSLWENLINKVYNKRGTGADNEDCGEIVGPNEKSKKADYDYTAKDDACPLKNCINLEDSGWLAKWLVEMTTNQTGNECNIKPAWLGYALCPVLDLVVDAAGKFASWTIGLLMQAAGMQ